MQVRSPICVVGDIHGQFQDLKELLQIHGPPPETNYLFLGDYVDRGECSVKTVTLAFLFKLRFPERVCLLRGNHECRQITQSYGFYDECMFRYGNPCVWKAFTDAFDILPPTALIENKVFCTHAGLSPSLDTIDDILQLDRMHEIPHDGPLCDLMWSDPSDIDGWAFSSRGAGYQWGEDVSECFNHKNGLDTIARAHQCVMPGYLWTHGKQVLTVFSAPNYAYRVGNLAAVAAFDENMECNITQFEPAPDQKEPSGCFGLPFPDYFETDITPPKCRSRF